MKKMILGSLLAVISTSLVVSQSAGLATAYTKPTTKNTGPSVPAGMTGSPAPGKVNEKIQKHFVRGFKKATNPRWYPVNEEGFIGYFDLGQKKGRCFYDHKGRFVYTILTYAGALLPSDVRYTISSADYAGCSIDLAEEVYSDGETVYVVHVSDRKSIKTLAVRDGIITVLKDLNKSK